MPGRKRLAERSPEVAAKARKLRDQGKTYKEIAEALGLGYDKAAYNLVNPHGPQGLDGKGRPGKGGKVPAASPSKAPGKPSGGRGGKVAGKGGKAKPKGRQAARRGEGATPAQEATAKDKELADQVDAAREESEANRPGGMVGRVSRPVVRPSTASWDEVRPAPKPPPGRKAKS